MQKNFTFHSSKIPSDELTCKNAIFTNFKDFSELKKKQAQIINYMLK